MRVLVTGVTGFLGSHLAKFLTENGHSVIGLKRKSSSIDKLSRILHDLELVDIEDGYGYLSTNIDAIIHTATCYGNNGETVSEVLESNVIFPLALLEKALVEKIGIFINASTFFCKANEDYGYLNTYIKSKKIFQDFGKSFCQTNKIQFANLILEHMYGPADADSKFITSMARQLLTEDACIDLTPGDQIRDFIHINDVISAFEKVLLHVEKNHEASYFEFEVGTGVGISIKDFVALMHSLSGSNATLNFGMLPYRPNEIMYSLANVEKLFSTGWRPQISMNEGIESIFSSLSMVEVNNR